MSCFKHLISTCVDHHLVLPYKAGCSRSPSRIRRLRHCLSYSVLLSDRQTLHQYTRVPAPAPFIAATWLTVSISWSAIVSTLVIAAAMHGRLYRLSSPGS